ncbi:hypothetical protein RBH29_08665 [Herbivorax sp. ANBcel31]|uniref:hypothetical protein n=1 Tax=Herbivorax sp. ANBcel31 TaxID=3069754 RepID=UPI0027B7D0B3|nr:hypothetical protein [Herbivorax sp. ANBcel31]MDQ2086498.1 hypothetical protein [Herbivorax sp. ANBcel31]
MEAKIDKVASEHNFNSLPWGISGGDNWIWHKQYDEKTYKIQICGIGNFKDYSKIKSDLVALLEENSFSLTDDTPLIVDGLAFKNVLTFLKNP